MKRLKDKFQWQYKVEPNYTLESYGRINNGLPKDIHTLIPGAGECATVYG